MLIRLIVICLCLGATFSGYSQTANFQSDTIRWNSTGFTDLISNVSVSGSCQFVTHGVQTIDWVQGDGSFVTTFNVTGSSGSWSDLYQEGTITVSITFETTAGQIIFSKSGSSMSANITLTGGTSDIRNSYTISSFEKL